METRLKHTASLLAGILISSMVIQAFAETVLYRYKNKNGVQVINSTIPSEYAQLGYQVINTSGEVLKTIKPAPTAGEIEKAEAERAIMENYERLTRRYSNIDDIQRAKERKLININTNISILNGSIQNINLVIEDLISQAAKKERAGQKVPQYLLDQLEDNRSKLSISNDLLKYRENEYREMAAKYDQDIRDFIQGKTLSKELSQTADGQ